MKNRELIATLTTFPYYSEIKALATLIVVSDFQITVRLI